MLLRKLMLLMAAFVMVVGLAACGSAGQSSGQSSGGDQNKDQKMSQDAKKEEVAPKKGEEKTPEKKPEVAVKAPADDTLTLTVPKMERVQEAEIPNGLGNDEALLRENAAIHLEGTGYPWEEEANVYIAGHRLGYQDTGSYLAFYDIDKLENGDEMFITDADGNKYTYEVFEEIVVDPTDLYVLDPLKGKNIVSLQACTLPDYSKRIIVRAELKDIQA